MQPDLASLPVTSNQGSKDVESDRQGPVIDLLDPGHVRAMNDIAEHGLAALLPEDWHGTPVVQVQIEDDGAQRRTDIRRVTGQVPDDAEHLETGTSTRLQPQIGHARGADAMHQQGGPAHRSR